MATVKLFGNLRDYGATALDMSGTTIRELLQKISAENATLYEAIWEGDGLRPFIRIMVNGRDSELAQGLDTPIVETDQIAIFPPITGG